MLTEITVFKYKNGILSDYIHDLGSKKLVIAFSVSEHRAEKFIFLTTKTRSKIKPNIKNSKTTISFVHALKKEIFRHYQIQLIHIMILFHCYFSNIIIDIIITIFFIFIVITNIVLSHLSCLNFIFSFFLFLCSLMEIGTFWSFFILFLSSVIQYLVVSILYYRNQCTVIMAFRLFNIVMCVYFY